MRALPSLYTVTAVIGTAELANEILSSLGRGTVGLVMLQLV